MEHHPAAEPEQELDGDLGQEQPGAPRSQRHTECCERDPHWTSNDVTHFVCNTPGLFGAMSRHG